jgi:serine/threonine-protein kinase RsbW
MGHVSMEPLIIHAELSSLGPIREFVMRAAKDAGLGEQGTYKLALALDELATNVIMYGYADMDPAGDILIRADTENARLRITMEDRGKAFDPRQRELPSEADLAMDLDERAIGGLGIFLALEGVDAFDYQRVDGANRNILEMNL